MRIRTVMSDRFRVLHFVFMLSLCFGVFNVKKVDAQNIPEELKLFEVLQIEWGNKEGQIGLNKGPGMNHGPQGFVVDEENNKIYILDSQNKRILIYNLQGELLSHMSTSKSERTEDLCLGNKENLYVFCRAESYRTVYKVIEYDLNGQIITTFPLGGVSSSIAGIQFQSEQCLYFETSEGTYPLMENGIKVSPETQPERKIKGLIRNNEILFLERKSPSLANIHILDSEGRTKKTVTIKDKEEKIKAIRLVGIDDDKNIYATIYVSNKRLFSYSGKQYIRKYNPEGQLLAEALKLRSGYTESFGSDLRVTGGGDVYQMLPIRKHVKVLKWALADVDMSPLSKESITKLFSDTWIRHGDFLPGEALTHEELLKRKRRTAEAKRKNTEKRLKETEKRVKELAAMIGKVEPLEIDQKSYTNAIGMKFVYIPAGNFMMGSESGRYNEKPVHRVTLTEGFYMQTTEVTQGQWEKIMGKYRSWLYSKKCDDDDCPVAAVPWNDIQEFIKWLNRLEGSDKYRLPTEAEWEYACRAGGTGRFSFGNDVGKLGEYAWYNNNSGEKTHPVGQKKPNAWGLYDMSGNVYEWCQDSYDKYSPNSTTNPVDSGSGFRVYRRMLRGGSWYSDREGARCAYRYDFKRSSVLNYVGFRLIRTKK